MVVVASGVVMCHVVAVVLLLVFQRWCLRNKKHTDSIQKGRNILHTDRSKKQTSSMQTGNRCIPKGYRKKLNQEHADRKITYILVPEAPKKD